MKTDQGKGFNRFLIHFQKDVKEWLFYMLYLLFFRLVFLAYYRGKMDAASSAKDVLATVLTGVRFDSMVSTCWIAIPFLASVVSGFTDLGPLARRLRSFFSAAFIILASTAWIITFAYFKEYDDQFNHFVFNLYYDDTRAILLTIWANYHPALVFLGIGIVIAIVRSLNKRFVRQGFVSDDAVEKLRLPLFFRALAALLILGLVITGVRGGAGDRPAQRKDIAVTADTFLNKSVINPFFSLLFAVQDHALQTGMTGLEAFVPDGNIQRAAQEFFRTDAQYADLKSYMEKHAGGPKGTGPRHIFLFIMESYDAWPFLPKYASLGLTRNLSEFGSRGLHITNFLPASDSTMQSLTAIVTSIPYVRIEMNFQQSSYRPYPSSLFETFKRLGYRTRLFYGGYLSWQRFGDFARDQGADEIYGAPNMNKGVATHEWGVDDEYLFDFISEKIDDAQPSFNLILNTSYHPPYNVDVWGKGFPLRKVPEDVAPFFDNSMTLKMLGHLWYADKCIGDFVRKTEKTLPLTLFAFTGDHFGRKFINPRPEFFERSAVPFILYGPQVLRGIRMPDGAAGAHIDIAPTLIELAAPKGFTYYSIGRDILSARPEFFGIGQDRVIGRDFIADIMTHPTTFYPIPGTPLPKKLPDGTQLQKLLNESYGLGWWLARRGTELETTSKVQSGKR